MINFVFKYSFIFILFFSFNLKADDWNTLPDELVIHTIYYAFDGTNLEESLKTLLSIKCTSRKNSRMVDFVARDIVRAYSADCVLESGVEGYFRLHPNLSPIQLVKVILARAVLKNVDLNKALENYSRFEKLGGKSIDFLREFTLDQRLVAKGIIDDASPLFIALQKTLECGLMPVEKCKILVHLLLACGVDVNEKFERLPINFVRDHFNSKILEIFLRYHPRITTDIIPFIQGRPHLQRSPSLAIAPDFRASQEEQYAIINTMIRDYVLRNESSERFLMQAQDHR